jgi:hypothetical protein
MYAFLLVLGAAITAAGLALLASGISIAAHAFDTTNVTPATITIVGGCILIGFAFVVRALLRVERALMSRPMPRPTAQGEMAEQTASAAQPSQAARIPFPPNPTTPAQPPPIPAGAPVTPSAAPPEGAHASNSQAAENPPVVEETDVSLLPKAPARAEEGSPLAAVRTNGAAPGKTSSAQVALSGSPAQPQQHAKASIFETLWPKTQQTPPNINTTPAGLRVASGSGSATNPPAAPMSAPSQTPAQTAAASQQASAALSILKSGVVEGMAYTLYSDGSIEAQLPGGTLRFSSITELRNHIEQNG